MVAMTSKTADRDVALEPRPWMYELYRDPRVSGRTRRKVKKTMRAELKQIEGHNENDLSAYLFVRADWFRLHGFMYGVWDDENTGYVFYRTGKRIW